MVEDFGAAKADLKKVTFEIQDLDPFPSEKKVKSELWQAIKNEKTNLIKTEVQAMIDSCGMGLQKNDNMAIKVGLKKIRGLVCRDHFSS